MRWLRRQLVIALLAAPAAGGALTAQPTAADASGRIRQVLPAGVAERVLARIADARSRGLPAEALEQRALKFAARGVPAADIERSVADHADRMVQARAALQGGRGRPPAGDEVEAAAEAIRQGFDAAAVSALAKSAPSGRSLALPLYVIGSLKSRGLPADEALARVRERLAARATDAELEQLQIDAPRGRGETGRPAVTGQDMSETKQPGKSGGAKGGGKAGGGPPAGVPGNAGAGAKPGKKPTGKPDKPIKP